jgi:hypothetical protein
MANGRCPRHGGKGAGAAAEDQPRLARSIYGFYGAEGCAMRDAAEAARTQPRLFRLVEALLAPMPPPRSHDS